MIREKIEKLRRTLDYHNHKYYVENSPEISDREFDIMMRELQELEAAHPEYADPNSPTARVGRMLSACSALQGTPQPAPPVTDHPQEIRRDQTQGLQRIGSVSTMVRGSPDDALAEIRAKAVAAKADYYVVVMVDETIVTGQWYSQAILYRK